MYSASLPCQEKDSIEGFGFVYLEASSHGLPILAHRIGGVEDAVRHEETGLLVDPLSEADLCNSLERLVSDNELRAKLGENGKEMGEPSLVEKGCGKAV